MKIVRREVGRFENIPQSHSYDLTDVGTPDYLAMVNALSTAIEIYESRGWTEAKDSLGETYVNMKSLHARLTDYRNHNRTFNGKKVLPYSQVEK